MNLDDKKLIPCLAVRVKELVHLIPESGTSPLICAILWAYSSLAATLSTADVHRYAVMRWASCPANSTTDLLLLAFPAIRNLEAKVSFGPP